MLLKEKSKLNLKDYYKEKNYIHYSNCHEDFLLLKKYLKPGTETILSVASGLDNSLSFLVQDNVKVFAFDFNPSQVYLGKLKIAAIENFSYEKMLEFAGVSDFSKGDRANRINLYKELCPSLAQDVKNYFDSHLFLIEEGLVNCGRFEQYFHLFRKKVFPLTCRNKNIIAFAKAETIEQQREIYKEKINTWRFKLMFRIFFSKKMMAALGRDKAFFKYSKDNLPKILKKRVDTGFNNCLNKKNPYYGYVLNSFYPELPFYLQKENFLKIKANIKNITIYEKTFDEMLNREYDFMNLSDIFEYMKEDSMEEYSTLVKEHLSAKGTVAFWNMMNVRQLSGLKRINKNQDYLEDRAFFYRDYLVYEK